MASESGKLFLFHIAFWQEKSYECSRTIVDAVIYANNFVHAKGGASVKRKGRVVVGGMLLLFCVMLSVSATAQQRPVEMRAGTFTLGVDIGLQGATADGTAFAWGLSGDYFLNHNVSVGPLFQMGTTDDLTQIGLTAQGKFTFDLPGMPDLKPHLQGGIGFIHADLDRTGRPDRDDTSFLIPLGFGAEYRLNRNISLGSSLLFNITDLDLDHNENFFISWLTGIRFRF